MDTALSNIAMSPYFNGSIMLLMNIGGKYLAMDFIITLVSMTFLYPTDTIKYSKLIKL